jgi:uncharacterized membrane protein
MEDGRGRVPEVERDTGRLEAFSDGVMAVIITIMAFRVRPPLGADLPALREILPSLLVYVLSFAFIYWNNHHHLLRACERISAGVMWSNLALLFWLSLMPMATAWVAARYTHPAPAATYAFVCLAAAITYGVLVRSIIRANGGSSAVKLAIGSDVKGRLSIVMYAVGIGLAFVSPWITYAISLGVAAAWAIPDRRFVRLPGD